jgi:aspartate-semialdehyde dehydrogenase
VNGEPTLEHDGILANRNCCTIPLTMTLKPLHDAVGLARVRVSTYQSVSRAGRHRMDELRATLSAEGNLAMDWDFEGEELRTVWSSSLSPTTFAKALR